MEENEKQIDLLQKKYNKLPHNKNSWVKGSKEFKKATSILWKIENLKVINESKTGLGE